MDDARDCPICLESFDPATRVPFAGLCGHSICEECILNSRTRQAFDCPECRRTNAFANSGRNILAQELLEKTIRLKAEHVQVLRNLEQEYIAHWREREERFQREFQQLQQIEGRQDDEPLYEVHLPAPPLFTFPVVNEDETIKRNRKKQLFKKFKRMIPFTKKKNISEDLFPVLVTNIPVTNENELERYFNAVTSVIYIDEHEMQTGDAIVYFITKRDAKAAYARNDSVMMGTDGEEKSIIVEKVIFKE